MNLLQLSWKNIAFKPLNTLLSIVLFALGVGLVALLLLLKDQMEENFDNNLAGVDLVIGAKGSPLQLILSSMYHIDAPTGNISLKEARPFLNPKHPLIEDAVPLSMGDNYRNFRIVGTTQNILEWYDGAISEGKVWEQNFEVSIGAKVANDLELKLGDTFKSSHGVVTDEGVDMEHEDAESFKVVGILKPTGTVLDQLILTTPQSFWLVHDHDGEASATADEHDHEGHDHSTHDHGDHHHAEGTSGKPKSLLEENEEKEITSVLVKFKGHNFQALNMQRSINENTDLQAATPAIEINRLFELVSTVEQVLRALAIIIIFVSALSIFISLYSSLRDRRYELALMRVMGSSRSKLTMLIILEGLLLAFIGCVVGLLIGHGGMEVLSMSLEDSYRYNFSGSTFLPEEAVLIISALVIGFIASILPAVQASRTDISEILGEG
ncbi:MAG: ABC transporter permease [Chitinophagales bacterium]|nr:ABC transporter permease [Chitinophagales bacterium]